MRKLVYMLSVLIFLGGCYAASKTNEVTIDQIDAEEVLRLEPDADIFQHEGVIYKTNVDWVEELVLTKEVQVGEIKKTNSQTDQFADGMANKLPVGAKIYSAKERGDVLLVDDGEKLLKYLAIVEG